MKPISVEMTVGTNADPEKYNAVISVEISRNPATVYADLSAAQRSAVLAAAIAAVRDALPGYNSPAVMTSEETTPV